MRDDLKHVFIMADAVGKDGANLPRNVTGGWGVERVRIGVHVVRGGLPLAGARWRFIGCHHESRAPRGNASATGNLNGSTPCRAKPTRTA